MIDAIREKTLKRLFDYITQDFEIWKRVQRPFSKLCHKDGLFIKKKKKETTERSLDRTYFKPNVVIKVCLFPQARS